MTQVGFSRTPYGDLLEELRKRQLAVLEQQNIVDRFVLNMWRNTNLSPEHASPKKRNPKGNQYRNGNQFVPGFVIDALNALPIDHHQLNGKTKLPTP